MDLQGGLAYVGVVVMSAVAIFLISMFGMKEKSYEEAIAEQRKLPDDLLLGKKEKGKEKKHKNKAGKKVKEKKEEREEKEDKEEKPEHVQFEETPQILPPDLPVQEACKGNKKKNKPEKVKPILVNKDESPFIVADAIASSNTLPEVNHFDIIHPKDDLELIRSHSKENLTQLTQSESVVNKSPKETPTKSKKAPKLLQKKESTEAESAPPQATLTNRPPTQTPAPTQPAASLPAPTPAPLKESSKKNKKKNDILAQIGGEKDGINVSLLMPLVQKAELSRSEIQILIDQLLNKQLDNPLEHSEWTEGRTDPVIKLKKQLAEKDKALTEEHEASVTFQNKLKELRAELNSERSRLTQNVKQLEEALNNKMTEAQTLHTRMQHILESHAAEKQGFSRQIEQLQAKVNEDGAIIHKMQADQGQTQGHLQKELNAQRQQLEAQFVQMRENEKALQAQLAQKHVECQELQNVNMNMTQELQATCESSTAEIEMLRQQLAIMQEQFMHAEGQLQHYKETGDRLQDMARQLEESHRAQADLDLRLKNAHRHEQDLQKQIHSLQGEMKMVKAEANEASALNGELNKVQGELMKLKSDLSHSQSEAKSEAAEITSLRSLLTGKEEEVKLAQGELKKLEGIVGDLKDELTRVKSDYQKMQEEQNKDKNEVNNLQEKLAQAQQEVSKASAYIKVANEATSELKVVRAELETVQSGVKKSVDLKLQFTKLQEENNKLVQRIGETQREVKQLREENEELAEQIASFSELPAAEGRENGVEEKRERVNNLESEVLKQKDSQIDELRAQLSSKEVEFERLREVVEGLKSDINSQSGLRKKLEEDLEAQRSKNNELRTKNWKVMEALSAAEMRSKNPGKCVDDGLEKIKAAEQESTKSLLQRIFPDIKIQEKSYDKWITAFEQRVSVLLTQATPNDAQETNTDMEKQNKNLQGMVSHYKQIIVDTEGMLNNLQSHVESEESRWQSELRLKENEIANLRVELKELLSKTNISDKLQEKISNLETHLAAEEAAKEEAKAELIALKTTHTPVKGGAVNFAHLEQLQEEKQRLAQELQAERSELSVLHSELKKLRSVVDKNEAEISRLEKVASGASSTPDQSAMNGPPSTGASKPESTKKATSKRRRFAGWFRKKVTSRTKLR
ncbi:kinectin isoform X1 [Diachasma alloeum]|uniref:kinectin isoform X1 n=1 Tax=Diachasma alloeum TaxID=454923 RepID=UPI0007382EE0|nr:kinectin isoform X1 [Diachasma alloeum]